MSDDRHSSDENRVDFKLLDQLRGLAALGVVIGHSRGILFVGGRHLANAAPISQWGADQILTMAALALTRLAPEFVIFFFVLSGFSIAYSLDKRPALAGFIFRRFVRLYPTYLSGLAWAAAVFLATRHIQPEFYSGIYSHATFLKLAATADFLSLPHLLKDLLYLPYGFLIEPYWSLSHEVIFYVSAPLFLKFPRPYYAASLFAYLSGWVVDGSGFSTAGLAAAFVRDYNIYFMVGIAVYRNWDTVRPAMRLSKPRLFAALIAIHLACVALGALLGSASKYSSALFALGAILLMTNVHNLRLFSPTLSFLGAASYSIYVTHFPTLLLLLAVVHLFIPPPYIYSRTLWLIGIPISLLGSMPIYFAVERRTKMLLDSMRRAA